LRKLWLVFAQAVTVTLAAIFVVSLVKPEWMSWRTRVVELREQAPAAAGAGVAAPARTLSYSEAARKAIPSVVNIWPRARSSAATRCWTTRRSSASSASASTCRRRRSSRWARGSS